MSTTSRTGLPHCDPRRLYALNERPAGGGPVLYWMSRDQRADDNWALLHAQELASSRNVGLAVCFCLATSFPGATLRAYQFMLDGLRETAGRLAALNIPFFLLYGDPPGEVTALVKAGKVGTVICDFDPLRIKQAWHAKAAERLNVPLLEVDAHNIVPARIASVKQEYGAYTLRPKLNRVLAEWMKDFPALKLHPFPWRGPAPGPLNVEYALTRVKPDGRVAPVADVIAGAVPAKKVCQTFLQQRLSRYAEQGNDPNADALSGLSPYLHFGHISAQRVARQVQRADGAAAAKAAFLEQLIVRRELSDNFCLYQPRYDDVAAFPAWARKTLDEHAGDPREYQYDMDAFEAGRTHDPLWNAAQLEMVCRGSMHSYLRMYWAKKILEWTRTPAEAMRVALALNDRYELDGRDPNGYVGVAWSMGGVHDRAWGERPVFGKIRYMSAGGCRGKFKVPLYIDRVRQHCCALGISTAGLMV